MGRQRHKREKVTGAKSQLASGTCSSGHPAFPTKAAAAAVSPRGEAKRCGRCRQWRPA
jgi:hypothetical protein